VNGTEGCKSEGCWVRIRDNHLDLSAYWKQVIQHWQEHPVNREKADGAAREDAEAVERVVARGAPTWLALARWGRETQSLQGWQATVASGIARAINSRKRPSAKQAAEGERVLEEARKKGFRPAGIPTD
jgi:hypothetical protein